MKENLTIKNLIRRGEYRDSVSLMKLAEKLRSLPGIRDSAAIMGSRENLAILKAAQMLGPDSKGVTGNDLVIAILAENSDYAGKALGKIDDILLSLKAGENRTAVRAPRTIEAALKANPDVNLALISIAGRFAGTEAMSALRAGLNVMLFSDNVPLGIEIKLKEYAFKHDLFVMGPDCGTAIIDGVPLGFANAVRRGDIGIVAASGTGLQEVSCIIHNAGAGISQAIGTGSRDVKSEVGGIMFIRALRALADDTDTRVILLVSKPPDKDVLEKIRFELRSLSKPVVTVFLGAKTGLIREPSVVSAVTLEEGALKAAAFSRGENPKAIGPKLDERDSKLELIARAEAGRLRSNQRYIRGLFSGGTFCYEAQVILKAVLKGVYSNAPLGHNHILDNPYESCKHTLVDMGSDEFTVGRLHPMIDFSLRTRRIIQEASDQETAVIVLDIVLGFGANSDPVKAISTEIRQAKNLATKSGRHLPFIASVTGTDGDPQNRASVIQQLTKLGVVVVESNAAAAMLAGQIALKAER